MQFYSIFIIALNVLHNFTEINSEKVIADCCITVYFCNKKILFSKMQCIMQFWSLLIPA